MECALERNLPEFWYLGKHIAMNQLAPVICFQKHR